jgi:hypothetical protein
MGETLLMWFFAAVMLAISLSAIVGGLSVLFSIYYVARLVPVFRSATTPVHVVQRKFLKVLVSAAVFLGIFAIGDHFWTPI